MKKLFIYLFLTLSMLLVPAVSLAFFDANLKYGAKGDGVKEMQDFLTDQGVFKGSVTGNFFSLTRTAVRLFQTAHKLPSTGFWGPMTRVVANQILDTANQASNAQEQSETGAIATPSPVDRCTNISGFQTTIPTGWSANGQICYVPQSIDVCINIEGIQTTVPAGMTATGNVCVIPQVTQPQPPSFVPDQFTNATITWKIIKTDPANLQLNQFSLRLNTVDDSFLIEAIIISATDKTVREKLYSPPYLTIRELEFWNHSKDLPIRECQALESAFQEYSSSTFPYPCPAKDLFTSNPNIDQTELYAQTPIMGYGYATKDWMGRDYYTTVLEKNKSYQIIFPVGTKIEYLKFLGQQSGKVVQVE